jgi:uncharacterized cysteine cluster protein YcgN (CxxCxxCC family)
MAPFWKDKRLEELTPVQWEALCDGCGRCCLQKLKHPTTGKVTYTRVACYLLDIHTCRCTGYELRHILVPDCLRLAPDNIARLRWLPKTCAYRLIAEGRDLPPWHPLVSADPNAVHAAGISVRRRAVSEAHVHPDDIENYQIDDRF